MIKKIAYIWLLAAIGIMAACTEDTFVDNRTKVDDDHLLVTFRTQVPEMAQVTTRNADPDGLGIQQLSMFYFIIDYAHPRKMSDLCTNRNTYSEQKQCTTYQFTIYMFFSHNALPPYLMVYISDTAALVTLKYPLSFFSFHSPHLGQSYLS